MRSFNRLAYVLLFFSLLAYQSHGATDEPYNVGVDAWRKKDYPEAAKQWSQAVLSGNIDALNNLAFLYFNGLGMQPRIPDAIRLWRIAAYSGQSESQWHLGVAYEDGKGVEKDSLKAYAWYRCAAESSRHKKGPDKSDVESAIERDALRSIEHLRTRMNSDEVRRGSALADEYIRRYGTATP